MELSALPSTKLKINKTSCIKYLKFLFYLKKYNLGKEWNKWNLFDTCLFQNEEKKTSLKMVLYSSLRNWRNLEKQNIKSRKKISEEKEMKKEKTGVENYLAYLMSKPISIASFDLDGTLVDAHSNNYDNKLLYNRHIFNSLQNLKNKYKKFIIFSNQTNVSSARDYKHLQFQKLPNLLIKITNFQNFVHFINDLSSLKYQSSLSNTRFNKTFDKSVNTISKTTSEITSKTSFKTQNNSPYADINVVSTDSRCTKMSDKVSSSSNANTRIDCGLVKICGNILCVRFVERDPQSFNFHLHFRFHSHLNLRKCVERNKSYLRKKFRLYGFYKIIKEKFHFFLKKYIKYKNNGIMSSPTKRKIKNEINKNKYKLQKIVLINNKRKIHFDFYLAIGKWGLKQIDIYPKPEIGLFALFICLEAIKQFLIWNCYFKNSEILTKQMVMKKETKQEKKKKEIKETNNENISTTEYRDYLYYFLKIYEEIFSINKIKLLTHNMKRNHLNLNNLALQILNIYIIDVLKKCTYFKEIEKQNIDMEIIHLFLNDSDPISFPISKIQEQKKEQTIMSFLDNTENLKHIISLLIYKNQIIKRLMNISILLFFNSNESFYVGNNMGRDFDKSDTDLMFARNIGITCIDQLK